MDAMDMWRQHMEKDWMFHGIVDYGGAAPNVVPEEVRLDYFYRADTLDGLYRLNAISERCAEGAALATGTKVSWEQRYPDYGEIYTPEEAHQLVAEILRETGRHPVPRKGPGGSSDVGNVSLRIPVFHPMLDVTGYDKSVTMHDRAFEACLHTEKADKVLRDGAYVMADLALRLAEEPALIERIRKDHAAYRGIAL
jgi:metal-dependent amidase/aminoacylase/carboxypeptidase family protein